MTKWDIGCLPVCLMEFLSSLKFTFKHVCVFCSASSCLDVTSYFKYWQVNPFVVYRRFSGFHVDFGWWAVLSSMENENGIKAAEALGEGLLFFFFCKYLSKLLDFKKTTTSSTNTISRCFHLIHYYVWVHFKYLIAHHHIWYARRPMQCLFISRIVAAYSNCCIR